MNDEQLHNSILRIHDKLDAISLEMTDTKIKFAPIPFRLKILERVVYTGIALILIAFTTSVIHSVLNPKQAKAYNKNKPAIEKITQ